MNRSTILLLALAGCGRHPATQWPAKLPVEEVDPAAPRQLLIHDGQPEIVWIEGTALLVTGAEGTSSPGTLAPGGRVLRFAATADPAGIVHLAAILDLGERVEVVAGRLAGGRLQVGTLASTPTVGGVDTHGDGVLSYPKAQDYQSVAVTWGPTGSTRALWTDEGEVTLGLLSEDGKAEVRAVDLPGHRVAATTDPSGALHVVAVGQPGCGSGGPFFDDHVVYAEQTSGGWLTHELGRTRCDADEIPSIVTSPGGVQVLRAGRMDLALDAADLDRSVAFGPGLTDGESFVWSTLVDVDGVPWLVGVSRAGTVHGIPVAHLAATPGSSWQPAPLVDLVSLPADATGFAATASRGRLFLVYSRGGAVHLRSVALPGSPHVPVDDAFFTVRVAPPQEVRLAHASAYGSLAIDPFFHRVHAVVEAAAPPGMPACIYPLSQVTGTHANAVVLPSPTILRLATPSSDGWEIEERALRPPIAGAPDHVSAPPGWVLQTDSADCRGLWVAYAPPGPARTSRLPVPADARWVSADDRSAYLLAQDRLLRVTWGDGDPAIPARIETVTAMPPGVDPLSIRIRDATVAYGLPADDAVVVGTERLRADAGAFAIADDGTVVVRRDGTLMAGARAGPATDALPLAARRAGELLQVVLRTPRGALVLADLLPGGAVEGVLLEGAGDERPETAEFVGGRLLVGGNL